MEEFKGVRQTKLASLQPKRSWAQLTLPQPHLRCSTSTHDTIKQSGRADFSYKTNIICMVSEKACDSFKNGIRNSSALVCSSANMNWRALQEATCLLVHLPFLVIFSLDPEDQVSHSSMQVSCCMSDTHITHWVIGHRIGKATDPKVLAFWVQFVWTLQDSTFRRDWEMDDQRLDQALLISVIWLWIIISGGEG